MPAGSAPLVAEEEGAAASLRAWAASVRATLVGAAVPAASLDWLMLLPRLGFVCVDTTLVVNLGRFSYRPRTIRAAVVRLAQREDQSAIVEIASVAFNFGRYHRDPRFPRALADRRFARWVSGALDRPASGQVFLVSGPAGAPTAFMFLTVNNGRADWHLAGVAPAATDMLPGPMFFAGVLDVLEDQGVTSIFSKISAANTGVLNIYAALGFRFLDPEFVFHWLPPGTVLPA